MFPDYADDRSNMLKFHKYFISAAKTIVNGEMLFCLQGIEMLPLNLVEAGF